MLQHEELQLQKNINGEKEAERSKNLNFDTGLAKIMVDKIIEQNYRKQYWISSK